MVEFYLKAEWEQGKNIEKAVNSTKTEAKINLVSVIIVNPNRSNSPVENKAKEWDVLLMSNTLKHSRYRKIRN